MGFESYRQGTFAKRLADLPDQPNMQAAELKTYFDSSPEELRQALNRLCDALGEFSAAAKLGYTASAGVRRRPFRTRSKTCRSRCATHRSENCRAAAWTVTSWRRTCATA